MPDKEWYHRNKKPCLNCESLVGYRSLRCNPCKYRNQRKSPELVLLVKRRSARLYSSRKDTDLRLKVLEKLGNKCVRCGFSDQRALQIDHVYNDGYLDRKKYKQTRKLYMAMLNDDSGRYQVLCANCNIIKMRTVLEERNEKKDVAERQAISSGIVSTSGLASLQIFNLRGQMGGAEASSPVASDQTPSGPGFGG